MRSMSETSKGGGIPRLNQQQRPQSPLQHASSTRRRIHSRLSQPRAVANAHPLQDDSEGLDTVPELPISPRSWKEAAEKRSQPELFDDIHDDSSVHPPSFAQSEFETIVRRQKTNPHGLKIVNIPSRYPTLDNDWEFAGWGSMSYLELSQNDMEAAREELKQVSKTLDPLRVSSIAANAVVGSVFYSFPAVAAASGVLSPIALTVACLLLTLYKPVMRELGSAARSNGSNYTYLLQFCGKTAALMGAAVTLLDGVATSAVSAATASEYLAGEFSNLPIPIPAISICFLTIITLIALAKARDSTIVTLSFFFIHAVTMIVLMLVSCTAWAKRGSATLLVNWSQRPTSPSQIIHDLFFGASIGYLGVSGFETIPSYVEMVAPQHYSTVISTIISSVTLLNGPLMLLVYALLPSDQILHGTNILSVLSGEVGGHWLRTLLVVDAMLVLCGGMATGIFTACNLMTTLTHDGVLPKFALRPMPLTGQPFLTPIFFLLACIVMYATAAFRLATMSSIFSVTVLTVLLMYPISNILLKFNRDRLPRKYKTSLMMTALAFVSTLTVLIGNLVLSPIALGLFACYFAFILGSLLIAKSQAKIARVVIWLYGQSEVFQKFKLTRGLDVVCVKLIKATRRHPICVWVKGDDIYHLLEYILYVRRNEPTGRIIFLHAYHDVENIPSELAPNTKILDEALPSITLDLTFVPGTFGPELVQAASKKLNIPKSSMFASCFGSNHPHSLADYRGLRVIHH